MYLIMKMFFPYFKEKNLLKFFCDMSSEGLLMF